MQLAQLTFTGPRLDESSPTLAKLPQNLAALLRQINGFIQYSGGLHIRGTCETPNWHSLESVMFSERALHRIYPIVAASDVPFGQDCMADQFILRDGIVHKLQAETGELNALGVGLSGFFAGIEANPVEYLGMQPLLKFQNEGGSLQPGQVLHAYPPFCSKEAASGVSLKAIPVSEAIAFLADFAKQIAGFSDGAKFQVKVTP
jgi:hypothetical protein